MTTNDDVGLMLTECFFALGQGAGSDKAADYDAIIWWRDRYQEKFEFAVRVTGNSWVEDRDRVLAVSRWFGHRARAHAGARDTIDCDAARRAAAEIEGGCQMNKRREVMCTGSAPPAF